MLPTDHTNVTQVPQEGTSMTRRLIVVSNRLPITITQDPASKEWDYKMSSGGLVSALSGLQKEMTFTWIGWPGNPNTLIVMNTDFLPSKP